MAAAAAAAPSGETDALNGTAAAPSGETGALTKFIRLETRESSKLYSETLNPQTFDFEKCKPERRKI